MNSDGCRPRLTGGIGPSRVDVVVLESSAASGVRPVDVVAARYRWKSRSLAAQSRRSEAYQIRFRCLGTVPFGRTSRSARRFILHVLGEPLVCTPLRSGGGGGRTALQPSGRRNRGSPTGRRPGRSRGRRRRQAASINGGAQRGTFDREVGVAEMTQPRRGQSPWGVGC